MSGKAWIDQQIRKHDVFDSEGRAESIICLIHYVANGYDDQWWMVRLEATADGLVAVLTDLRGRKEPEVFKEAMCELINGVETLREFFQPRVDRLRVLRDAGVDASSSLSEGAL